MAKPTVSGVTDTPRDEIQEKPKEEEKKDDDGYLSFFDKDEYEIDEYFEQAEKDWELSLSGDEYYALRSYTGYSYESMNKYLREGKFMSNEDPVTEKKIWDCLKAIKKFKLDANIKVWRKSTGDLMKKLNVEYTGNPEEYVKEINRLAGSVVRDKGFVSTSTKTNKWKGDVHYEIRLPKGAKAAYVNHTSKNPGEMEVIVRCGAQFKVVGARTQNIDGAVRPVVVLEYIK